MSDPVTEASMSLLKAIDSQVASGHPVSIGVAFTADLLRHALAEDRLREYDMDARKRTLHVELTDEQAPLYMNSPTFKQGVDAFLSGVVPLYLDGLAARAQAMDAVTLARTQTLRLASTVASRVTRGFHDGMHGRVQVDDLDAPGHDV